MRSMARYSDRFIVANTAASVSTGHHCGQLNVRNCGRPTISSTAPATHCRIATTPAGPSAGNANVAVAAPN